MTESELKLQELKSCPFCGEPPAVQHSKWFFYVICQSKPELCPVKVETLSFSTRDKAIAAWNRRRLTPRSQEKIKSVLASVMIGEEYREAVATEIIALVQAEGEKQ